MKGRRWVCRAADTLAGCRRRKRRRKSLVNIVLAVTMFHLREGGDGPHVHGRSAGGGGERPGPTTALVLRLLDAAAGWFQQVVQAVAAERSAAEDVKTRRES